MKPLKTRLKRAAQKKPTTKIKKDFGSWLFAFVLANSLLGGVSVENR